MKKLLSLVLMLTVVLSMAGISQAEMVLKLGHYANADHAGNDAAKMFAEGVEKGTNGEVKVEIYPNNEL